MIHVVASVPHSGTRTLVKHLDIGDNSPRGRWLHFGYYLDEPRIISGMYHLHIPVRDPMDVAKSWAQRGKNIDGLIKAYNLMFKHMDSVSHSCHKMEDIPVLDGSDDHDRDRMRQSGIAAAQGRVLKEVVSKHQDFFDQYYG